jgi:hypothetical protein
VEDLPERPEYAHTLGAGLYHDPHPFRWHRRLEQITPDQRLHRSYQGLFQAAKLKARGYTRLQTMKTVLFLIAGKLNFAAINPHTLTPLKIQ